MTTYPFADDSEGRLSRRQWWLLVAGFAVWHLIGLTASRLAGAYTPDPSNDHSGYMREVIQRGYPTPSLWPPGFSYYLAFKWKVTHALGLPYATGKYTFDLLLVVLSGLLSVLLGLRLTRNRWLGIAAGVGLLGAPIFIMGVGMEEAAIFSQPFFLAALIVLADGLMRNGAPRFGRFAAAGGLMGVANLIRSNTQFIFVAVFFLTWWVARQRKIQRSFVLAATLAVTFAVAQWFVGLPWAMLQRRQGQSGVVAFGGIYRAYFKGITRHPGNPVSDWLRLHYKEPTRSLAGVVKFNAEWIRRDPLATVELYVLKAVRSWYMSDSGRWDRATLIVHLPIWIAALAGLWVWCRRARGDPALVFMVSIIVYMWGVSAVMDGIARYSAPLYGFLGSMVGLAILAWRKKLPPLSVAR